MVDPSIVTGALISGLVGVGIVEYRTWRDRHTQIQAWYTKSIRLAERIENAEDEFVMGAFETLDKLPYIKNTCAGVHGMMAEHLTEAPFEIDSKIIERGENLVEACQLVNDTGTEHNNFLSNFRRAQKVANGLISEIETAS